jgi:hypothetical protein
MEEARRHTPKQRRSPSFAIQNLLLTNLCKIYVRKPNRILSKVGQIMALRDALRKYVA